MDKYIDLIKQIKQGDEVAFNQLLENHKRMIYKIIYSQRIDTGDFQLDVDNLFQEGCLSLYEAVFSFEEDKGMSFTSYAYMVIRSHINTYIRDNRLLEDYKSLDNYTESDYQNFMTNMCINENPIEYHREKEFEKVLNSFVSSLNNLDKQIFELRTDDFSYKQISERLKVNTKFVDNRLRTLRKRLREHLEKNE